MTGVEFHRNSAGFEAVLKSAAMHRVVAEATEKIAENARAQGVTVGAFAGSGEIPLPVTTEMTTTDRAHGTVLLAHPAGIAAQAKHGVLTKAASAEGLDVKGE